MPSKVPLLNSEFINSSDFNNQVVAGITGSGVFRQFTITSSASNLRTLSNFDLWRMIRFSGAGNTLVTIPAGLSANVGDEILLFNSTGRVSFTTSGGATLVSNLYISEQNRPARLIYAGSNAWLLAGSKSQAVAYAPTNCCTTSVPTFYTFDYPLFNAPPAYADMFGLTAYTYSSKLGNAIIANELTIQITDGVITSAACDNVGFNIGKSFYTGPDPVYDVTTLYTYYELNINDDPQVLGTPFKSVVTLDVLPCDVVDGAAGTYYRDFDYNLMEPVSPICLNANGVVISVNACP